MSFPEITDDDRQFLHDNPNTDDLVKWVEDYGRRIVEASIIAIEESQPPETTPWDCVDAIRRKFCGRCGKLTDGVHTCSPNPGIAELRSEVAKLRDKNAELLGMREEVLHYQREFHRLRDESAKLREQLGRLVNLLRGPALGEYPMFSTILEEPEGEKNGL